MLQKKPKSPSGGLVGSGIKAVIVIETLLFIGAWVGWQRLRSSRSSRLHCLRNYPYILEKYYSFEEYTSPELKNRILDQNIWQKEGKLPQ